MALNIHQDHSKAPAMSQSAIDILYPNGAGMTLWKLSQPGRIFLNGIHSVQGPQLAADGTVLVPSQTFYGTATMPSQYAPGLIVAGP